jgi:hypothetical protein
MAATITSQKALCIWSASGTGATIDCTLTLQQPVTTVFTDVCTYQGAIVPCSGVSSTASTLNALPTSNSGSISSISVITQSITVTSHVASTSGVKSSSNQISSSGAAGIGLGCAAVGAFLAGFIAFLLLRRKKRPVRKEQHLPYGGVQYAGQEKPDVIITSTLAAGGAVTKIDRLLPQPAEDGAITGSLSSIRDSIKNHAQNFYHSAPINPEMIDEASLVDIADATSMTTGSIRNLLSNPTTRVPMIRMYLSHMILSRCVGGPDATQSFLPNEVSTFVVSPVTNSTNSSKTSTARIHL